MDELFNIIDESVKDDILRYPTHEIVSMLFPGHKTGRRGLMRSPFRNDRNPSFSCFKGRGGYSFWKDHSTDESGDNISLFRKVFPELSYIDAVDRLSLMLFGRSALNCRDVRGKGSVLNSPALPVPVKKSLGKDRQSVLNVVSDLPILHPECPDGLRKYWRSRGISDMTISRLDCRFIVFENINRKGMFMMDSVSGLPLVDKDGQQIVDDGRNSAIGLYNDIGGVVLRVPESEGHKGFKGGTSSFVSTILADGSRPASTVYFGGEGSNAVAFSRYDSVSRAVQINSSQAFVGVLPEVSQAAVTFCDSFVGQSLDLRDVKCICAVLCSLNSPKSAQAVVVEGMFDALSEREISRLQGAAGRSNDLVVLNSIGNIKWAVPFLSRHRQVSIMLDNDQSTGAGQKAFRRLADDIKSFAGGVGTVVMDGSVLYENYKDLNDALMAGKGFPVKSKEEDKKVSKKAGLIRF